MASRKCKKHPYYQGIRKPRARDKETGELCADCLAIYAEVKNSDYKEQRERKPRVKAKAKKVVEEVGKEESAYKPSFNPQSDSLNELPVVVEQDECEPCEPCVSDEALDEVEDDVFNDLEGEEWDEELDDDDLEDEELDDKED